LTSWNKSCFRSLTNELI